jgi:hypothetical protein
MSAGKIQMLDRLVSTHCHSNPRKVSFGILLCWMKVIAHQVLELSRYGNAVEKELDINLYIFLHFAKKVEK